MLIFLLGANRPGAKRPGVRNDQGRNDLGRNAAGAKRLGGELDLGRNDPDSIIQHYNWWGVCEKFIHIISGHFHKIVNHFLICHILRR